MRASKITLTATKSGQSREETYKLRVLFVEGQEGWFAQCLEYDIATQAKTLNDLFYEIERVLVSQIALDAELGRKPFEGIGKAPKAYWEAFRRSQTRMRRPSAGLESGSSVQPRILPTIRVAEQAA